MTFEKPSKTVTFECQVGESELPEIYDKPTYMQKYNANLFKVGQYLKIKQGNAAIHYRLVKDKIQSAVFMYDQDIVKREDEKNFVDLIPLAEINRLTATYLKAKELDKQVVMSSIMRTLYLPDVDSESIMCLILASIRQAIEFEKNTITILESPELNELNNLKNGDYEWMSGNRYDY